MIRCKTAAWSDDDALTQEAPVQLQTRMNPMHREVFELSRCYAIESETPLGLFNP
jgi:hypothetical protein